MKYIYYLLCSLLLLLSCSEEKEDVELYFMGDSQVEIWDVENYFPSHVTHNWGLSGSGIEYLKSLPEVPAEAIAIVITGTNDLHPERDEEEWDQYVTQYLETISKRGGQFIIVLNVFPNNIFYKQNILPMNLKVREQIGAFPNLRYIDLYDVFVTEDGGIRPEFTIDGLHLSPRAFRLIAHEINKLLYSSL